jgi:hypothetical protein
LRITQCMTKRLVDLFFKSAEPGATQNLGPGLAMQHVLKGKPVARLSDLANLE